MSASQNDVIGAKSGATGLEPRALLSAENAYIGELAQLRQERSELVRILEEVE